MINDGDCYRIVNKEKTLSLLDDIEQNIVWFASRTSYDTVLCSQDICDRILIPQRIWRKYHVGRFAHVRFSRRQHQHYTAVHELCCIKLNSDTVSS